MKIWTRKYASEIHCPTCQSHEILSIASFFMQILLNYLNHLTTYLPRMNIFGLNLSTLSSVSVCCNEPVDPNLCWPSWGGWEGPWVVALDLLRLSAPRPRLESWGLPTTLVHLQVHGDCTIYVTIVWFSKTLRISHKGYIKNSRNLPRASKVKDLHRSSASRTRLRGYKGSPQRSFIFRLHDDCVRGGGPQNVNIVNSKSLANVAELSGRGARLFYLRKKRTNCLRPWIVDDIWTSLRAYKVIIRLFDYQNPSNIPMRFHFHHISIVLYYVNLYLFLWNVFNLLNF